MARGRKARSYTSGPAIRVELKIPKRLALDVTGGRKQALATMAQMGGEMLHRRVERGVAWDGSSIPGIRQSIGASVGRHDRRGKERFQYFFVAKSDPRTSAMRVGSMRPWNMKGQKGPPQWWVFRGSYAEFKVATGLKGTRGSSFTGQMWRSLSGMVRQAPARVGGGHEIRLYFAGSSPSRQLRPGGRGEPERFRNRDKARLLQYAGRTGVGQAATGGGTRLFELMRFAQRELDALAGVYAARLKLST